MSGTSEHDRLPDQAALDELSRAFGNDPAGDADPDAGGDAETRGDASEAGEPAGDPTRPTGEVIAQAPVTDRVEAIGPAVPPPTAARRTIVIGVDDAGTDDRPPPPPLDVPSPGAPSGLSSAFGSGAASDRSGPGPEGGPTVITIDDDDLPDALTIDGTLDPNTKRPVVVIDDDLEGDAVVPASSREVRRGIEPRMRERRLSVRRARHRKRLKWVALGVGVVVVVVGALALLGSSLFAIEADRIEVVGAVYTDADALAAVVDDLAGTPALRVDEGRLEEELEAIPWVERAEVTVDFPSTAVIELRERRPMTTYQGPDGRYRVLDREGRVLDVIDGYPFAYVLLTGPDPVDLDPGEFAPLGYAAASELTRNLTPPVRGRVATIEVTADGTSLTMILDDGRPVRFGEARELFAKLVRLDRVLTSGEVLAEGTIDVSTEEVTVPQGSIPDD